MTAIVLGVGVLAVGCGQSTGPRATLAEYIKQVDSVELALRAPLRAVSSAGNRFAIEQRAVRSSLDETRERERERSLIADAAKIAALGRRLAAIDAPPTAQRLRSLLLELNGAQLALTRQVAKMVLYIPQFSVAMTPLEPAIRRLEPALSSSHATGASAVAKVYAAKAAALRRFAASLEHILARLRTLRPPAVSRPGYLAQVAALRGMSSDAETLANALASGRTADLAPILLAFDRASASNQSASAQRAQITAVRAYDSQVETLDRITGEIEVERSRLASTVH